MVTNMGQAKKGLVPFKKQIPISFFESLNMRGISFEGKKVADIGARTGTLTRKLKLRNADVIGVELSEELLEEAKRFSKERFVQIPYVKGSAQNLDLEESRYDMVTVYQAWHLFKRERALKEIRRILKPKGKLIVADSRILRDGEPVETTIRALENFLGENIWPSGMESRHEINGYPVEWFTEWRDNGFELRDFYKLDFKASFSNEKWLNQFFAAKDLPSALLKEFDSQFGARAAHTIPYVCNVCILESN
ncbi:class I SAM-dependent methyltransferase [Cytobacillus sp. NCCP-133]|uniref:class I SAM-dependent methyltransferase n=1 Tax=Cytobacillus sp. NCCP-133 TaxID=766848 RepID=UPI0022307B45|nr:class I SAM-dependent methyltransferase [Cytobacillus sp. NCCP-133]GLB61087.1 hypothetical protein NCCP133_32170 [Cytobacillus sp. NCCP-133]